MTEIYKQASYTLDDIQGILFELHYDLDPLVMKRIAELEENLIIPLNDGNDTTVGSDYQYNGNRRAPHQPAVNGWIRGSSNEHRGMHSKRSQHGSNRQRGGHGGSSVDGFSRNKESDSLSMETWESVRNFKPTQFVASEGITKMKNELSAIFNKLSKTSLDTQKDVILSKIASILQLPYSSSDSIEPLEPLDPSLLHELINHIFTLSSGNKILVDVYANLYEWIMPLSTVCREVLNERIQTYRDTIHEIHYVDPNADYDGFCDYNKKNDTRKLQILFIVHLMLRNVVDQESVLQILLDFLKIVQNYIDTENRTNEIDEITENIFLIVSTGKQALKTHSLWTNAVLPILQEMSQKKAKEYKSLTSRAVFKYMDIVDLLKK